MPEAVTLHASAIAFGKRGLLIRGESGSGKSTLALHLIGLGATLVADDRVACTPKDGALILGAPEAVRNLIEARGLGLLATPSTTAVARAVVDLDHTETERMPPRRDVTIAGLTLPLLWKVESPAFPAMLRLWLEGEVAE